MAGPWTPIACRRCCCCTFSRFIITLICCGYTAWQAQASKQSTNQPTNKHVHKSSNKHTIKHACTCNTHSYSPLRWPDETTKTHQHSQHIRPSTVGKHQLLQELQFPAKAPAAVIQVQTDIVTDNDDHPFNPHQSHKFHIATNNHQGADDMACLLSCTYNEPLGAVNRQTCTSEPTLFTVPTTSCPGIKG